MCPNNIAKSICPKCHTLSYQLICHSCKVQTIIYRTCKKCGRLIWDENLIVKPDGRSVQCRACQYLNCNKLRREKRMSANSANSLSNGGNSNGKS